MSNTEADHTKYRLERAQHALDDAVFALNQALNRVKRAQQFLEQEDATDISWSIGQLKEAHHEPYIAAIEGITEKIEEMKGLL